MQVSRIIKAPRARVYAACLDPVSLAAWRVPDRMTATVQHFDPRVGGGYRMTLTYRDPRGGKGKTTRDSDSFTGRFVELVPDTKIVEVVAFDSADPGYAGAMTITTSFEDLDESTNVTIAFDGLPPGIRPEDNETGTRQSLAKLAALLEGQAQGSGR
ncbi:hypothetical protein GCM10009087_52480 [Sphingomonas oligophenolica]|uniref:SRPBCC family protein n=1 Tax=Sphingomonas oligophenolica TaxID=301154 RepID=A0ABU9Y712_9SPHN